MQVNRLALPFPLPLILPPLTGFHWAQHAHRLRRVWNGKRFTGGTIMDNRMANYAQRA